MSVHRIAPNTGPVDIGPVDIGAATSSPLSVDLRLDDVVLVVRISGELDMATGAVLEDAMRPYRGMHISVSYDLTDLTFIDCAGLRALLTPANGDLFSNMISVKSASRCVQRLLEILQLQSIIAT
jgi:anti-anti-sigma factor